MVGVGIGPFNLGLAALLAPLPEVDAVFFDAKPGFSWHPGLLLDGTTLQVPFLADLVTLADPTSPYSFLNYLHCRSRLYRFYFYERFHIPRREYDAYCRWVADQLPACRFGRKVTAIEPTGDDRWSVVVADPSGNTEEHRADAVVLGVGSAPTLPAGVAEHLGETVFHSADYLSRREDALAADSVTVVGSGQSAAEVFADLLAPLATSPGTESAKRMPARLRWFTRSRGFLPMEYSKLGLEHFTPEYTTYFHGLPEERRDALRAGQDLLYKGISADTSAAIFDALYEAGVDGTEPEPDVQYVSACELQGLEPDPEGWRLHLHHLDQDRAFDHVCQVVVLATGYEPAPLPLAPALAEVVERDRLGRPVIDLDYRVRLAGRPKSTLFAQNAELHTHGVGAPDLGLGAHRNAVLVNTLAGRDVYPVRSRNVFQTFGAPATTEPVKEPMRDSVEAVAPIQERARAREPAQAQSDSEGPPT